jgi:hypothetical protein
MSKTPTAQEVRDALTEAKRLENSHGPGSGAAAANARDRATDLHVAYLEENLPFRNQVNRHVK